MKVEKTIGWLREEINKSTINEESKHINMHIRDAILMLAKENQPESCNMAERIREIGDRFCDYFFHNIPKGDECIKFKTLFYNLAEAFESKPEPEKEPKLQEKIELPPASTRREFEIKNYVESKGELEKPQEIEVGDCVWCNEMGDKAGYGIVKQIIYDDCMSLFQDGTEHICPRYHLKLIRKHPQKE